MDRFTRRDWLRATGLAGAALAAAPATAIEPIKRLKEPKMKIACCAYSFRDFLTGDSPPMTMEGFIDLCAEMGLDGTELTSYYFPADFDEAYLLKLRRQCFLLGLDVSGTAVGGSFTMPAGEARDRQLALVKTWIDHGAVLGAPCIRVFAGDVPQGLTEEEAIANVIAACQECADYGATRGVVVALENHGGVTATPEQTLQILSGVDSEWFGLNLDTGNFHTADPYGDMEKVAPYTVTTHIKTHVTPQGGPSAEVDFARVASILGAVGYRGYLSFEYEAAEDPHTALPRLIAGLREAIG